MEDMHVDVKDLQIQFALCRRELTKDMEGLLIIVEEDCEDRILYLKYMMQKLETYKQILNSKVNMVLQFLLTLPETPVCLYAIMPDEDSLPHFFPALYPYLQEPKDAEGYVQICDQLKL